MKAIAIQRNRKRKARLFWPRLIGWLRPTFWALFLGGSLFLFYAGAERLMTSPLFQVRAIRWEGLHHLKEPEMTARFRWIIGRNLFRVDIARIQGELQSNSWVKEAVVRKEFPDHMRIQIFERIPAAVEVAPARRPRLRDEEGKILESRGEISESLPRFIHYNPASYAKGLELASLVSNTLKAQEGASIPFMIDMADPEDLVVYFEEGVLHFGKENYAERWRRFLEIREDLERRGISDREIDLRYRKKIIVKEGVTLGTAGDPFPAWPGEKEDRRSSQF